MKTKISASTVKGWKLPGRYRADTGLYAVVDKNGNRRWIYRYTSPLSGRVTEAAIGNLKLFTLAEAREKALEFAKQVSLGIDPNASKRNAKLGTDAELTFEQAAAELRKLRKRWGKSHREQFDYHTRSAPFAKRKLSTISIEDVKAAIEGKWETVPVAARHMLNGWSSVFEWAISVNKCQANPAEFKRIKNWLPDQVHVVTHHKSLGYETISQFMTELQAFQPRNLPAYALEMLIRTGVRTTELLNAPWSEISLEKAVWTIPASRMKSGREHRVPLVSRVVAILKQQYEHRTSEWVWQSPVKSGPLANGSLLRFMKYDLKRTDTTSHGFRSSLRSWLSFVKCDFVVSEEMLAHATGDATVRAYARYDTFDDRRRYLEMWSDYIDKPTAKVLPFAAKA